jgi:hypothetical protein
VPVNHHFVPQCVLRRFACADAWQLLPSPRTERQREHVARRYAARAKGSSRGNEPLCVFHKSTGRLETKAVRDTCCAPDFYRPVLSSDPARRHLFAAHLPYFTGGYDEPPNLAELREIGKSEEQRAGDDPIEKHANGALDNDCGRLIHEIEAHRELDEARIRRAIRFLFFAHYRTPAWKNHHWRQMELQVRGIFERDLRLGVNNFAEHGYSVDELVDNLVANMYLYQIVHRSTHPDFVPPDIVFHVRVFEAHADIGFVTCDNPGRAFVPEELDDISGGRLPGSIDSEAILAVPVSPRQCIVASTNQWMAAIPNYVQIGREQVLRLNSAILLSAIDEVILPKPSLEGLFLPGINPIDVGPPRVP